MRYAVALMVTAVAPGCGGGGYAGIGAKAAAAKAEKEIARLHPRTTTSLRFDHQEKGRDRYAQDAWVVYFNPPSGAGSVYSGCKVYVRGDEADATPECRGYDD